MTKEKLLNILEDKEVKSCTLEEIVLVKNGRALAQGEDITNKITDKNADRIFTEYTYQEGITDINGNII